MKLLIMGLPGAGKTSLAGELAPLLRAVWYDADYVRYTLWPELGFSPDDRIKSSRRMSALCDSVRHAGHNVIASFVCPTEETRAAFGASHTIWVDRIKSGRFADTNQLFVPPTVYDLRLDTGTVDEWVDRALELFINNERRVA